MRKKGVAMSAKAKQRIFYAVFATLPILQFLIFYVGVNVNSVIMAFTDGNTGAYVGFENISKFFNDILHERTHSIMLFNSLKMFIFGTLLGTALALFFSFYVYKKAFANGFFKVILFLPSIIPSISMALIFKHFCNIAIPNIVSEVFGLPKPQGLLDNPKTQFAMVIFYNVWISFGVTVLMYSSAMSRIPESVVEYSRIEGCSYFREFFFLTLPLINSTLITFLITGIAGFFTNQANIYSFWRPGDTEGVSTVGYALFRYVQEGAVSKYPYVAAGGILFTLVAVPACYGMKFGLEKLWPPVEY